MAAIRDYWEEKCIVFDLKGILENKCLKNVCLLLTQISIVKRLRDSE